MGSATARQDNYAVQGRSNPDYCLMRDVSIANVAVAFDPDAGAVKHLRIEFAKAALDYLTVYGI